MCVEFSYHMYGENIGRLEVWQSTRQSRPFFDKRGDQGDEWSTIQTDIELDDEETVSAGYIYNYFQSGRSVLVTYMATFSLDGQC